MPPSASHYLKFKYSVGTNKRPDVLNHVFSRRRDPQMNGDPFTLNNRLDPNNENLHHRRFQFRGLLRYQISSVQA
jgi:hypothetical protein